MERSKKLESPYQFGYQGRGRGREGGKLGGEKEREVGEGGERERGGGGRRAGGEAAVTAAERRGEGETTNDQGKIPADATDAERIVRAYYGPPYANKFNDLDEMVKFFGRQNIIIEKI